ncbi:biotin/lipoyl-binding protein [Sphingobium terrigena]|uniref:Biotin/lipoyl-binding protein n=1 Tax=Sphingobium terrigena TaxID=2304063 RepID=A0A418YYB5_9SPHN|nr:biotin/lipoyl-containing protein [Sphingobium terrigena]RJG57867.1 biotin/lipoyl-binding protein [Sphingobium terrigena]
MQHIFEIGGVEHRLWLARSGEGYRLHLDGGEATIALANGRLRIDGVETSIHVAHEGDRLFIHIGGDSHELLYQDPVAHHAAGAGRGSQDVLHAPMPGVVVALSVEEGQAVKEGDILLVIESMKLETAIRAPRDGVIETAHLAVGKSFERDAPLISLAPLEAQA